MKILGQADHNEFLIA